MASSRIREIIENHLTGTRKRLDTYIKDFIHILKESKQELDEKTIENRYKDVEPRDANFFNKTVDILKWKKDYDDSKKKIEDIMRKILADKIKVSTAVTKKYKYHSLQTEKYKMKKKLKASEDYHYDRFTIHPAMYQRESVNNLFTYIEEDLLLEELHRWGKYVAIKKCHCRLCALEHLHSLAYKFAEVFKKPDTLAFWKNIGGPPSVWLFEFELRHTEYISKNFPSEEKCKKKSNVASQTSKIPSDKEFEYAKDESSSLTGVSQFLSSRTEKISKPTLPTQSSDTFQIVEKYVKNEIRLYIGLYKNMRLKAEKAVANDASEEDSAPKQKSYSEVFKHTFKVLRDMKDYKDVKAKIKQYFENILSGDINLIEIAKELSIKQINDYEKLQEEFERFEKLRDKYEYDRYTLSKAFTFRQQDLMLNKLLEWNKLSGICHCCICALNHFCLKVAYELIWDQCHDRYLNEPHIWLEYHHPFSSQWVFEFYVSKDICRHFPYENCILYKEQASSSQRTEPEFIDSSNVASTIASQLSTSLQTDKEISELSTSAIQRKRKLASLQASNVSTMSDPISDATIRENITKHWKMYERLEEAIYTYKSIIRYESDEEKDHVAQQAIKYKYENIIKEEELKFVEIAANISVWKEVYDAEKDYMESVMWNIQTGYLSYRKAKKNYPKFEKLIDYYVEVELENRKMRDKSDKCNYDKYIEDPEKKGRKYFTYNEEDLLLEELNSWKESQEVLPSRICALVHLCTLTDIFAKDRNKTQILELWKHEKADKIRWLREFAIRHKKHIFKNFSEKECIKGDSSNVPSQIPDITSDKESGYAKDEPLPPIRVSQPSSQKEETLEPSLKKPRVDK